MDLKLLVTVFGTVFAAEIADKTQIATLLYATNAPQSRLTVFLGSALALALASGIAVLAGSALSHWIQPKVMSWLAGAAFIGVGIWTIVRGV
jgi:putative Ca2+/H+ antiporter (TMEM165/GDT1 family)